MGQTLARSALLAASVPYVLSVVVCFLHPWFLAWLCSLVALSRITVGFLLVFRFVVGYTLLCSFAGCRCWAPAPGAAALAGLMRFASVVCCFCVLASSWCLLLVFSPRSRGVDLILRLARKPWHWHGVRYSLRPFPMCWVSWCVFSILGFVAWLCSLVALPHVCVPAGLSPCSRVYFALLLCWLPLLGACSRRCGSCRPPEVSFALRSFWRVRFFWFWGVFCVFGPVCLLGACCWFSCHSLEVLTSSCAWWVKLWHGVRYSPRAFPMC